METKFYFLVLLLAAVAAEFLPPDLTQPVGRTGRTPLTSFAVGEEMHVFEDSMKQGAAWAEMSWDEDYAYFEYSFFGLPYRLSLDFDYNPTTPWNEYPDGITDGIWQGWIVAGMREVTYYWDGDSGELIGNEYDLGPYEEKCDLPDNVISEVWPAFHMICTTPFESDPASLRANPVFKFDKSKKFLDDAGLPGCLVGQVPANYNSHRQYCADGTAYHPVIHYTDADAPGKRIPKLDWEFFQDTINGGGQIMMATSLEPKNKNEDYPYLKSRDNLMLGWGGLVPTRGAEPLDLTGAFYQRHSDETGTGQFPQGSGFYPFFAPNACPAE